MKQTVVEWLENEIDGLDTAISHDYFKEKIQQALELFEQQIKDAYVYGFKECEKIHEEVFFIQDLSEQYYNETYKKDKL